MAPFDNFRNASPDLIQSLKPATFRDLMKACQADPELDTTRRRDMLSAI